ncbi:MAG: DUF2283 domain-containing protein [Candidatus Bathyarchaeia archaeon]
MLEKIEQKYGIKLPRKVITIDYGDDVGDLFIRFKHAKTTHGEPTKDGQTIIHYNEKGEIAAIEILNITSI